MTGAELRELVVLARPSARKRDEPAVTLGNELNAACSIVLEACRDLRHHHQRTEHGLQQAHVVDPNSRYGRLRTTTAGACVCSTGKLLTEPNLSHPRRL